MTQPRKRSGTGQFPLLQVPPGVIQEHLLPQLRPGQRGALACCCSQLRTLVQSCVRQIHLPGEKCCLVAGNMLHKKMPHIQRLKLTPCNLHEAMYTVPIFFMTVSPDWAFPLGPNRNTATAYVATEATSFTDLDKCQSRLCISLAHTSP
jgi:hypothetical protein